MIPVRNFASYKVHKVTIQIVQSKGRFRISHLRGGGTFLAQKCENEKYGSVWEEGEERPLDPLMQSTN